MKQVDSINGQELRDMFAAATGWLEKSAADIDALNVFPVPDGDTGTNMLLTMRSAVEEAYRAPDKNASVVAQAMATGALMGARGNSGVILSQIWRGWAQGVSGKEIINAADMVRALLEAAKMAYKGLSNPVEGTILTVMKDAAKAAEAQVKGGNSDIAELLDTVVSAARESVANTPTLLPVLKEAGVVDAGGQGLYTILEGASRFLKGEAEVMRFRKPQIIVSNVVVTGRSPQMIAADEIPYGYCTEFLLKGKDVSPNKVRGKLEKKGQSLIVVGNDSVVRVHIHTLDPGDVVHYATGLGTLHQVSVRNMDEQRQDFLEMQKERMPSVGMAIVTVVAGDGLKDVFTSLGAAAIVQGGQTMNPSTKDLLQAVEAVPSDKVIILPNNKNVVLTAGQVHSLTKKSVKVVPTETIPQGVAALLAFDYEGNFDTNVDLMNKAKSEVKTIEITRAVRSAKLDGLSIRRKQAIGFLDKDLVAVNDSSSEALLKALSKAGLAKAEVVTIYYGDDTEPAEAEQVTAALRTKYPKLQIEVVKGGQPHYNYIVSIE